MGAILEELQETVDAARRGERDAVLRVLAMDRAWDAASPREPGDFCDSPIEELFYCALWDVATRVLSRPIWWLVMQASAFDAARAEQAARRFDQPTVIVYPQYVIGTFRVDFMLEARWDDKVSSCVVECDGHDFHERTKAQASYDRRRDRTLTRLGFTTLRFTGSELHADPFRCAGEALWQIREPLLGDPVCEKWLRATPFAWPTNG